mmetsp:Transcript_106212/g.307397  ORF Transcript_106212/g.307397 Transcript_106212/m.307397 type:complete len:219 (+) Transcript_106212:89-745(+)
MTPMRRCGRRPSHRWSARPCGGDPSRGGTRRPSRLSRGGNAGTYRRSCNRRRARTKGKAGKPPLRGPRASSSARSAAQPVATWIAPPRRRHRRRAGLLRGARPPLARSEAPPRRRCRNASTRPMRNLRCRASCRHLCPRRARPRRRRSWRARRAHRHQPSRGTPEESTPSPMRPGPWGSRCTAGGDPRTRRQCLGSRRSSRAPRRWRHRRRRQSPPPG